MMKRWPSALIVKFLQLYEKHRCLWNPRWPTYKNRKVRNKAVQEIVEVMSQYIPDIDIHLAKAKIRSIRNAYLLERHKVVRSSKEGASEKDIYTPTVPWYPVADRFLKYVVESKDLKNSLEVPDSDVLEVTITDEDDDDDDDDDIDDDDDDDEKCDMSDMVEASLEDSTVRSASPTDPDRSRDGTPSVESKRKSSAERVEPVKKFKAYNITSAMSNAVNALPKAVTTLHDMGGKVGPPPAQYDVLDAFGKVVATQLRGLPLNKALDCQLDILNYLVEKRKLTLPEKTTTNAS